MINLAFKVWATRPVTDTLPSSETTMFVIYLALTLGLLYLHLLSVTLLAARWLPYPLARAGGLLLLLMAAFFVEHFVGLGKLVWLWPLSTALALALVWRMRTRLRERALRHAELAFVLAFLFGLLWRALLPHIDASSERLTDLYFIANYYGGPTLPGPDLWFAGRRFDFYYAFQHYACALMGRWFGMSIGLAYNIGFALLTGLALALAWDVVARMVPHKISRGVLIVALAAGGTGVSPLFDFLVQAPADGARETHVHGHMWGSSRFIGNFESRVNTEFGRLVLPPFDPATQPAGFEPLDLPMENFGYHYFVGDYHPPLGAFFILFLMLALIAWLEQAAPSANPAPNQAPRPTPPNQPAAAFLLALCVPAMFITNAWILPMQALLLLVWGLSRKVRKLPLAWPWLVAGGVLGFVLIYPFLNYFVLQVVPTAIRFVSAPDFTPPSRLLVLLWPLLLLFGLLLAEGRKRPLAWVMLLAFGLMLLAGEVLWVDDPNAGRYERNNTTMKWWGWAWSGAILMAGALALASSRRWLRLAALAVLLGPCWQLVATLQFWYNLPPPQLGKLEGHTWLSQDKPVAALINYLKTAPPGRVLENWQGDAYTPQTAYALFGGQAALMGWPNHLNIWRNNAPDIWLLRQQVIDFYQGKNPDALGWLLQHQVRYVAWGHNERRLDEAQWQKLDQALKGGYDWHGFSDQPNNRVGLWVRRN